MRALLMALAAGLALQAGAARAADEVYVIGALHGLHAREDGFGFAELRRILEAAKPDVLVLEVRPDELAVRGETQGRPEYPQVVWPYLRGRDAVALPLEPGGETFARMTGAAGAAIEALRRSSPVQAKSWSRVQGSADIALQAHWRHPADAHDTVTADVSQAVVDRQAVLAPGYGPAQTAWDGYMADRAREAVMANPGKRVLVLASYRNRHVIEAAVRSAAPGRVTDTEAWLRQTLPAAP